MTGVQTCALPILNAVADLLRAERTAAVPVEAADPHAAAMQRFFAEGQPFRDYKARQRAIASQGDGTDGASGELAYEERLVDFAPEHWQEDLLDSARRGEHIIALVDPHTVRVQLRSAL